MAEKNVKPHSLMSALILSGIISLALAYISYEPDDRLGPIAIWLPAGVTLGAYLSLPRSWCAGLSLMMFAVRLMPEMLIRNSFETSLIISLISLISEFIMAAITRYSWLKENEVRTICIWLGSTLLASFSCAIACATWMTARHSVGFECTVWLWWVTNFSCNIVTLTIIAGFKFENYRPKNEDAIKNFTSTMVVGITTLLVFNMPCGKDEHTGLAYSLACLPFILLVIVSLTAGKTAGSLSFLTFFIITIFSSFYTSGPFFISGLHHYESIGLVHIYLSVSSLLVIIIRLVHKYS